MLSIKTTSTRGLASRKSDLTKPKPRVAKPTSRYLVSENSLRDAPKLLMYVGGNAENWDHSA